MRGSLLTFIAMLCLSGCSMGPEYTAYSPPANSFSSQTMVYPNPIFIAASGDPQRFWETLVDVVDDYFQIEHEEPVRAVGNMLTEGALITVPQGSPTIFEPWRADTGTQDQRIENTIQTMQRVAKVRVIPAPTQGGYWVELAVLKQLEDNPRPDHATAGAATLRYDSSLTGIVNPVANKTVPTGWIDKGRDTALEQRMIGHLLSRFGQAGQRMTTVPAQ
jgi:hypothetical protein